MDELDGAVTAPYVYTRLHSENERTRPARISLDAI